ncbi:MAG TPA: ABC transporter ATP-binding protein [Xanthobacteraceae bacterium]|jgi:branched-chain amino acid transport system ATP-binding protein
MSVLSVRGISKSYGGVRAVDGVSLELERGRITALIGPNGAGKSTCFNLLNGQIRPDAGDVVFNGKSIVGLKPRQIWKLGVGRTFQVPETYGSMTVRENVQMVLLSKQERTFDPFRRMSRMLLAEAAALLDRVGMASQADRPASVLAYGDVKRLELAMAMANDPILLLMDEPTAGMAPQERNELMALTVELVRERDLAVLFTEHSMDVVFSCAHDILVLSRGRIIASGPPDAVRENREVQEVYLGSAAFRDSERAPA